MASALPFPELLRRIRLGDPSAIEDFVSTYAPYIRRSVRFRLSQLGLRSVADSEDLCQSVLKTFLIRAAARQYDLTNTEDLHRLLLSIARNKLVALARREPAQRRDHRRLEGQVGNLEIQAGPEADPVSQVAARDLLTVIRTHLSAKERELFQARQNGDSWATIAGRGDVPEATLRKRLSRTLQRVAIVR
jgi:DNA-directed RNA polymerase specialized sigma24 family protein